MVGVPDTPELHHPRTPVRVVTAASLFDGHDASINIMRRHPPVQGAEVIHLGHNRSVDEVVKAVVEEDAAGVAVSSYQGGHVEYFELPRRPAGGRGHGPRRRVRRRRRRDRPEEIDGCTADGRGGSSRPEDGQRLGLAAMVNTIIAECDRAPEPPTDLHDLLGRLAPAGWPGRLTAIEVGARPTPSTPS